MRIPLPARMSVLYNRNFRLYFTGQLISLTGTWMQAVAQGWVVLDRLGGTAATLGLVTFAVSAPTLVLLLTAGVVSDRWDRRKLMIATQTALMVLAFVMCALLVTDRLTLPILLVVSVLIGVATAYEMPAQTAMVPSLVSPPEIPQAIALNQVIFNGSRLLGPAAAGLAIRFLDLSSVYFLNGLSFVAVIASLCMIRVSPLLIPAGARGSMLQSVREGLSYLWSRPMLRNLYGIVAITVFLTFPAMAVLPPLYVKEVLRQGPGTIGLLMSISGGASMFGAIAMLWIPARRRGQVMAAAIVTTMVSLSLLALFPHVAVTALATGAISLGFSMFMGLNQTIVQLIVPNYLRGRVSSVSSLLFNGGIAIAGLLMAVLVDAAGFAPVYLTCAILFIVSCLWLLARSGVLGFVPPVQTTTGQDPASARPEPEPAGSVAAAGD